MARRRVVAALVVSAAAVAGALIWRRRGKRQERVDLYFADGSMVSFEQGSLQAQKLLPLGRDVLSVARGDRFA
jgi:hypothetical protein